MLTQHGAEFCKPNVVGFNGLHYMAGSKDSDAEVSV